MQKLLKTSIIFLFTLQFILLSNIYASNLSKYKSFTDKKFIKEMLNDDTLIIIDGRKIFIKYTNKPVKGTFLLLHGWNFSPLDWCNKTQLCDKALGLGYNIVMPDMGKSIYHSSIYPETRADWKHYPTRPWLIDTLFPILQTKYNLLLLNERNFIVGLSTGARGVALIIIDKPKLFIGAAALSGDYDQGKMPTDNLCKGYYGDFKTNKLRWQTVDNVMHQTKKINTPIYLGHGVFDKICDSKQTLQLYNAIKKNNLSLKIKLNMPKAKHDYEYWSSEIDEILKFFGEIK